MRLALVALALRLLVQLACGVERLGLDRRISLGERLLLLDVLVAEVRFTGGKAIIGRGLVVEWGLAETLANF